mmetsp:Transcript_29375/g.57645  ORF Transcript_29375/g.57645 Transcript_29375/m.57645 type:complete len:169 (-) Transcript_29375:358-864(-)|eukprot:CAMPEP_0175152954 /NCGR_PEP_ID=MMETSP0087-20121206/19436_1 /TAXON_ID=136419 /ORGANISM="Unknown Unknown, Strain D1" /LENGTH=168 /DNA_ID=CAMNT_0016439515 /DNA_START=37 /DNA_END=543 /DNA_ORIENTATION=-
MPFGFGMKSGPVKERKELLNPDITLGSNKLKIEKDGSWTLVTEESERHRREIAALKETVRGLQRENELLAQGQGLNNSEQSTRALKEQQRTLIDLSKENDILKFQTKVLLAMCTISEGDYQALCREANVTPKAHTLKVVDESKKVKRKASKASSRGSSKNRDSDEDQS